jgi:hypothetical protein
LSIVYLRPELASVCLLYPAPTQEGFCQRSSCASDATWMHPLASGCAESLPWPAAPVRCSSIRLRNDVLRLLLVQHLKRAHAIAQANHKPPRACWGLSGLARDHTKPFPAAEECGTHCLDGRGADEVSWDATQRVQSVGAWQLNSAALAPWGHRERPIAPRDWVEIRCLPSGSCGSLEELSSCAAQISTVSEGKVNKPRHRLPVP